MSATGLEQNGVLHSADVNGDDKPLSNVSLVPAETITRTEEPMDNNSHSPESKTSNRNDEYLNGVGVQLGSNNYVECKDSTPPQDESNAFKPRSPVTTTATTTDHVEAEWIDQYEPGVYITLVALRDGSRDLKRVRFRYILLFKIKNSYCDLVSCYYIVSLELE